MGVLTNKKINLLLVTRSLCGHGGIEETLRILCHYLNPSRFRIGLCSIKDSPEQILAQFQHPDIELFALNRKGFIFDWSTTLQIKKIIQTFQADIVHTHTDKGNWHGRLAARLQAQAGIVTTHHDLGDAIFTPSQKGYNYHAQSDWVSRFVYPCFNILFNRWNDKIICVSKAVRAVYTSSMTDSRYEVVYAPYEESLFQPASKKTPNTRPTLGIVGRLTPQKGHCVLLQALSQVIKKYPDVLLKIKGSGILESELKHHVQTQKLTRHVQFCGDQPHNAGLYHDLDIYLQPSLSEGCSITLLEAMGCAIPVIATDQNGPSELIESGKTGLLVPVNDSQALQTAICELLEHPEKARQLASAARYRVRQNFNTTVFIEAMSRIYQEAACH